MTTATKEIKFATAREFHRMKQNQVWKVRIGCPPDAQIWAIARKYTLALWYADWLSFCQNNKIGAFYEKNS